MLRGMRWRAWIQILSVPLMAIAPLSTTAIAAGHATVAKPDFSAVTTRAKAAALARKGELVRILLFPAELGGEDRPENVSYITPEAAEGLSLVIGTLRRFVAQGLVDHMTVEPEYRGASLIPTRIVMHATSKNRGGSLHPAVEVW